MTVQEIMERIGMSQTGRAIAYIKDSLEDMNTISETHTRSVKMDIVAGQRFYNIPKDAVKILDIRCKNQLNSSNEFRTIPRMVYEPEIGDSDGK